MVSLSLAHYVHLKSPLVLPPEGPPAPKWGKHAYLLISSVSNCDTIRSFSSFYMGELVFSSSLCRAVHAVREDPSDVWRLEQLVANCILVHWDSQLSELDWCEVQHKHGHADSLKCVCLLDKNWDWRKADVRSPHVHLVLYFSNSSVFPQL